MTRPDQAVEVCEPQDEVGMVPTRLGRVDVAVVFDTAGPFAVPAGTTTARQSLPAASSWRISCSRW
ncbi:hypothetical protein BCD48_13285 [Pseudofrankia sp. BMG5.36]|nr:hypothetical protein BCD48_13285 [Pseudofrankia sp. BMG5.36]